MPQMKEKNAINDWDVINNDQSFQTALENMMFDEQLLNDLKPNQRIIRIYKWQQPGITFSYKQSCPEEMASIDHAKRLTGGGIVFHSPGDQVFSLSLWGNDPIYIGSLTNKLSIIANQVKQSLLAANVALDESVTNKKINYDRCQQYPTPFEIIVDGKKICGLTIRRFKDRCLIQGVLHNSKTNPVFHPFVTSNDRFNDNENNIKLELI